MPQTRREFLQKATAGAAGLAVGAQLATQDTQAAKGGTNMRIGMCDWSMRQRGSVEAMLLAKELGLDGVEVSVAPGVGEPGLRDPAKQKAYLDACKEHGVAVCSLALGSTFNRMPLKSEPKCAIWLVDAIPIIKNMGATNMLLAFFGRGELKMDEKDDIQRVVDVLKECGPRAQQAGVILGLENTLSAEDNMRLLEMVDHPSVRVYYDPKNSAGRGRDVPEEIRTLKDLICQVHVKNGPKLLSEKVDLDFPACAEALKEIGYDGWYVLETSSPNDLVSDTKANIEYVRQTFG